jgi:hypothetical protein
LVRREKILIRCINDRRKKVTNYSESPPYSQTALKNGSSRGVFTLTTAPLVDIIEQCLVSLCTIHVRWYAPVCWVLERGTIMKNNSVFLVLRSTTMKNGVCKAVLGIALCALVVWLAGCAQPGETKAEGYRRHQRNLRISQEQLADDIDAVMLTDKPSRLSDKRIH